MQSSVSAQANFNQHNDDLPVSASAYDVTGYAATVAAADLPANYGQEMRKYWSTNMTIP